MLTRNASLAIVDDRYDPPEDDQIAPPALCRDPADFPSVSPIFTTVPGGVHAKVMTGAGPAAEVCRDLVLGTVTMVLGEALTLAERLGLRPEDALDIASGAVVEALRLSRQGQAPGDNPPASTQEMLSRFSAAQAQAARAGTSLPVAATAQEVYALHARLGGAAGPFTSVRDMLRGVGGQRTAA